MIFRLSLLLSLFLGLSLSIDESCNHIGFYPMDECAASTESDSLSTSIGYYCKLFLFW